MDVLIAIFCCSSFDEVHDCYVYKWGCVEFGCAGVERAEDGGVDVGGE